MRDRPGSRAWALAALLAAAPAQALTLARDGQARARIVLAETATPAESTAARELAGYLGRAVGARFEVLSESDPAAREAPAIHVGPTRLARGLGLEPQALGREQWIQRTLDGELLLCGGRPRGTLYAVFRFLEEHVGVRWWTPWDESVPERPTLEVDGLDASGRPAFSYRDVSGLDLACVFCVRNRLNGYFALVGPEYGDTDAYGPPVHVHSFFRYVPPQRYFETHPEYFSEIGGLRLGDESQLCLTQPALLELVAAELVRNVSRARREAAARGSEMPRLFDFSQNDWGKPCTCKVCGELARREGSESAPIVAFVNRLADAVGPREPDVLLNTLAYGYSFRPPRTLTTRDNVVVRLSALYQRDFSKPLAHRANREVRRAVAGWSRRTRHLRIWDYIVTYGAADLPLPNLEFLAHDLRYYRRRGVEGMFVQHDHPIAADLRDLKAWVLLKLLEDPARDAAALVRQFTDGYYGPAGESIRSYLAALGRAARRRPAFIGFAAEPSDYAYLDRSFLSAAARIFDQAEARVASEAQWLGRVRHARLSLDRALLLRGRALGLAADELAAVARRYRSTWEAEIERRLDADERAGARKEVQEEIERALAPTR
jgi:hypothetical protein